MRGDVGGGEGWEVGWLGGCWWWWFCGGSSLVFRVVGRISGFLGEERGEGREDVGGWVRMGEGEGEG
jgi:hypothetical protein